jgi:hypothetical protein
MPRLPPRNRDKGTGLSVKGPIPRGIDAATIGETTADAFSEATSYHFVLPNLRLAREMMPTICGLHSRRARPNCRRSELRSHRFTPPAGRRGDLVMRNGIFVGAVCGDGMT